MVCGHNGRRFAALALLCAGAAAAAETVDFELPRLDGRDFFHLSALAGPAIVNFWDPTCPPCAHEMPMLDRLARDHAGAPVVGVSLSPRDATRDFLDAHPVGYAQLLAPAEPRGLLRRFGDPQGALPHTVVLREDHSICASHTGEVDRDWLVGALQRCRAPQAAGGRR